jgi:two-component system, NtrC family, response regulator AtoC
LKKIRTEARFICATNQDVGRMVREGTFRRDLYFRLNVGSIRIPPLSERRDEILPLAELFLEQIRRQKKTRFTKISRKAARILEEYSWPGNVRELKNTVERIVLYFDDEEILPGHLAGCFQPPDLSDARPLRDGPFDPSARPLPPEGIPLNGWILKLVERALEMNRGNQTRTAQYLGISVRVLQTYLKRIPPKN